jgi:hypothetical protein
LRTETWQKSGLSSGGGWRPDDRRDAGEKGASVDLVAMSPPGAATASRSGRINGAVNTMGEGDSLEFHLTTRSTAATSG